MAKIGYNFAYGGKCKPTDIILFYLCKYNHLSPFPFAVKPGDEPNYPTVPTTGAELLETASDLFAAAKNKISSATIATSEPKAK